MTYVHQLVVTTDDPGYSAHVRNLLQALGEGLAKLDKSIQVYHHFESVRREDAPHE